MKRVLAIVSHLVFWSWNLVFIGIVDIWLLPEFGLDLLFDTRNGLVEPTFIVSFLILLIVPLLCTVLGFWRLRSRPTLLLRLFYGVEAPLFTMCLLRLFLIRELTAASAFTLGLVIFSIFMFAIELLAGYAAHNEKLSWVQMVGHSLMLVVGGYAGSLLLLYTVPAFVWTLLVVVLGGIYGLVTSIFSGSLISSLIFAITHPLQSIFGLLFAFLGLSSLFVFVSMPYAFVHFYIRAWKRIHKAFGQQYGIQNSWAITGVSAAICIVLFVGLQLQPPQVSAFELLEPTLVSSDLTESAVPDAEIMPAVLPASTMQQRNEQLQQADDIRIGLTNAYLHRYRYLSPWSDSNALSELYKPLPKGARSLFQTVHNSLISPFLYRGEDSDSQKAESLYEQFFDQPIQQGEREAIRAALQATANRDETKAGLLDLDQKVVRLSTQDVKVSEHGDWATVEIHERYENKTPDDQEIFYSFSLPESAVISGL